MKKPIYFFFIITIITLPCCKNKKSEDSNFTHLNQLAKNINTELQNTAKDISDLTLILKYKIPFNKPVTWDSTAYHVKSNRYYFTPDQKKTSSIYLPENVSLNNNLKKMIINSEVMDSLFIKFMHDNDFVQQIYFLDTNSFLRIYPSTDVYNHLDKPFDLTKLLPYQKVYRKPFIEDQSYWIETPYADFYGRGWIISCIEPVYYHDQFIGILAADIPVYNFLKKYFSNKPQILILTDDKGNVICTTQQGSKRLNIPMHQELSYYKPANLNLLQYNSPSLTKHQDKSIRNAVHKILEGSVKEFFHLDGHKHTIYKTEIEETNWLLLKIIY
ncbi:MAG: cache domain-containing protein [Bacteroidota bacterium]